MKKITALLLSLVFVLSGAAFSYGAETVKFTETVDVTVLKVIDGDSLLVRTDSGSMGYVHLAGITTLGYDSALKFVTDELLGAKVTLLYDSALGATSPFWSYMYVYKNGNSVNEQLLLNGFAKLSSGQKTAMYYQTLLKAENEAKAKKIGVWSESAYSENAYYSNRMVNINLASSSDIASNLKGISSTMASNIVKHRNEAPFKTIYDIKFVDGFTKKMFDENYYQIAVSTDINSATVEELSMLEGLTATDAKNIVSYRVSHSFSAIEDLTSKNVITKAKYNVIKNFIDVTYRGTVISANPDVVVNVNTATSIQLQEAGLSEGLAAYVIKQRVNGYTIKHIGELAKYKDSSFSTQRLNYAYDNLTTLTDVNEAPKKELVSLFGNGAGASSTADTIIAKRPFATTRALSNAIGETAYERIKNHIFVGKLETVYVNVNTATESDMKLSGFTGTDAYKFANASKTMLTPSDIPMDVAGVNHRVTLYTNINTATKDELLHLSVRLTETLADKILTYRSEQPFGTMEELDEFFRQNSLSAVYKEIEKFVVLR